MPAKDRYHNIFRDALIEDGWQITHDPYLIETKGVKFQVDLGAEKIIAATKNNQKIAVEIKSFLRDSFISEFHTALGQFLNYQVGINEIEKDRILYLGIPKHIYLKIEQLPIILKSLKIHKVKLVIFDLEYGTISKWIK